MSKLNDNLQRAKKLLCQQRYYVSIVYGVMYWDFFRGLPPAGRPYMGQVGDFLRGEMGRHMMSDETRRVVNFFRDVDPGILENDYQRACVSGLTRAYDRGTSPPAGLEALSAELGRMSTEHQMVWQECHEKSDWKSLKPYVKKAFDAQARLAEMMDPHTPTYDVIIGNTEEGMTAAKVEALFSPLRDGIKEILSQVRDTHSRMDTSPLDISTTRQEREDLVRKAALAVGFDLDKGIIGERMHPYCGLIGPRDSRPSPNYEWPLFNCIAAITHECGHGMYNYSSNDQAVEWGLWGGAGGFMQESQARFTECMMGKSRQFWQYLYPQFQESLPALRQYDLDAFYTAMMCIKPTPNPSPADELTSALHIILRFELEKAYFEGSLGIDDLEEALNQKYEDYMGVRPKDAREGILRDMHWPIGLVGYYPNYALGDLFSAQMRAKVIEDIPNAYEQLSLGDPSAITGWLRDQVWQYGATYSPDDIILRSTGQPLSAKYRVEYLREKYLGEKIHT